MAISSHGSTLLAESVGHPERVYSVLVCRFVSPCNGRGPSRSSRAARERYRPPRAAGRFHHARPSLSAAARALLRQSRCNRATIPPGRKNVKWERMGTGWVTTGCEFLAAAASDQSQKSRVCSEAEAGLWTGGAGGRTGPLRRYGPLKEEGEAQKSVSTARRME